MKKVDLEEFKKKKEGVKTPKDIIENILEAVEQDKIEDVLVIVIDKEGEVRVGWSAMSNVHAYGMLELSKEVIRQEFIYSED